MSIRSNRVFHDLSVCRLRRARRLYGYICSKTLNSQPAFAIVAAKRAKDAGLYSESTAITSIVFSLCRYAYKNSESFDRIGGFGWYEWIGNNSRLWDHGICTRMRNNKPHIKLTI
jgi:hypothetical protein